MTCERPHVSDGVEFCQVAATAAVVAFLIIPICLSFTPLAFGLEGARTARCCECSFRFCFDGRVPNVTESRNMKGKTGWLKVETDSKRTLKGIRRRARTENRGSFISDTRGPERRQAEKGYEVGSHFTFPSTMSILRWKLVFRL